MYYLSRLTDECEAKESYVVCTRCTESVHKQLYELHQMEDFCRGIHQSFTSLVVHILRHVFN